MLFYKKKKRRELSQKSKKNMTRKTMYIFFSSKINPFPVLLISANSPMAMKARRLKKRGRNVKTFLFSLIPFFENFTLKRQ